MILQLQELVSPPHELHVDCSNRFDLTILMNGCGFHRNADFPDLIQIGERMSTDEFLMEMADTGRQLFR